MALSEQLGHYYLAFDVCVPEDWEVRRDLAEGVQRFPSSLVSFHSLSQMFLFAPHDREG